MLIAARAMQGALDILRPLLADAGQDRRQLQLVPAGHEDAAVDDVGGVSDYRNVSVSQSSPSRVSCSDGIDWWRSALRPSS